MSKITTTYETLIAFIKRYEKDFTHDKWTGAWFKFIPETGEILVDNVRDERYAGYWIYQHYIPHYDTDGKYLGYGTYSDAVHHTGAFPPLVHGRSVAEEDHVEIIWIGVGE